MKKEQIIRSFGIMLILIGGILIIIEKHIILAQIMTFIGVVAGLIYAFKKGKKKSNEEIKIKKHNFLINLLMIITISFIVTYSFAKYL
jgi:membrane-bound ClpP family serine protease